MRALPAHIARFACYAPVRIPRSSFGLRNRAVAARNGATRFDLAISGLTAGKFSTEARSGPVPGVRNKVNLHQPAGGTTGNCGSCTLALRDNLREFTNDAVAAAADRPDDESSADGSGPKTHRAHTETLTA